MCAEVIESNQDERMGILSLTEETVAMKQKQVELLTAQNAELMKRHECVEHNARNLLREKLVFNTDNSRMRDENIQLRRNLHGAKAQVASLQKEIAEKDKQLLLTTDQNSELLHLLENEEHHCATLCSENQGLRRDQNIVSTKYKALLVSAKTHEEIAKATSREGQVRANEARQLRAERDELQQQFRQVCLKSQVEVESLHEQLRVRKEKHYKLIEKLQAQDRCKVHAEDQVAIMANKVRQLHAKGVELDAQLRDEKESGQLKEASNRSLASDLNSTIAEMKSIQERSQVADRERFRMESEARDSGRLLKEMAEKVFQLLERLKIAELGKARALEEAMRNKTECTTLSNKNSHIMKELATEGRCRIKSELQLKHAHDQLRSLKKQNLLLASRCREEVDQKHNACEDKALLERRVKTLTSRLSYLLHQMQAGEAGKLMQVEDLRQLKAQLSSANLRISALTAKLDDALQANRVLSQALLLTQDSKDNGSRDKQRSHSRHKKNTETWMVRSCSNEVTLPDVHNFTLVEKHGLIEIKAMTKEFHQWLEHTGANKLILQAQQSRSMRRSLIEQIGVCFKKTMIDELKRNTLTCKCQWMTEQAQGHVKKSAWLQNMLTIEEEAKRCVLLRYIDAIKRCSSNACSKSPQGIIELTQTSITDEEMHALAAILRCDFKICTLNLAKNVISDFGVTALASVLAGKSGLTSIDLRGNRISRQGVKLLADSLGKADRTSHVYVHANGVVEAVGLVHNPCSANVDSASSASTSPHESLPKVTCRRITSEFETICVVNCQENSVSDYEGRSTGTNPQAF